MTAHGRPPTIQDGFKMAREAPRTAPKRLQRIAERAPRGGNSSQDLGNACMFSTFASLVWTANTTA
eukprot:3493886-Pyramimonas_sp.AAC.1